MTKAMLIAMIISQAQVQGVDPDLAVAVAEVESGVRVEATGLLGEVGIFQIRPEFQPSLTKEQLRRPKTNIRVGIRMIKRFQEDCFHKKDIYFVICFNFGPANAGKVKNPDKFPYVVKVKEEMRRLREERALASDP